MHNGSPVTESNQSAGGRLRTITVDQAIAGASNVLIAVLAARLLDVASFGFFGVVFLLYVLVQGVNRALVCDPLLVHPLEGQQRSGEVIGTSCVLGLALGVLTLLTGVAAQFWDHRLGGALLVMGLCLPLLVLQDLGRYMAFAVQRPAQALVLDVTWLVAQCAAVGVLLITDTRTLPWFVAAWAGAGAGAGLLLFAQWPVRSVRVGLAWLRYTWSFSWRYLVSYTSLQSAALGAASGVGAIAGTRALGALQGATLLVRPFATFQVAAVAASIGEITRSAGVHAQTRRLVALTSLVATTVAVLNAVVLLVLPASIGRAVLGDSWAATHPLLLPTGVQIVCLGVITGVRAGLLGMRRIAVVMRLDLLGTAAMVLATTGGAVVDGVKGALWGVALSQAILAALWWTLFWRATDHGAAPDPGRLSGLSPVTTPSPIPPATAPLPPAPTP